MINNINKLSEIQFIKIFTNIFENSQFIAEDLYKKNKNLDLIFIGDSEYPFLEFLKKILIH